MAKNRSVWGISSAGLLSTERTNPEVPGLNADGGQWECRQEALQTEGSRAAALIFWAADIPCVHCVFPQSQQRAQPEKQSRGPRAGKPSKGTSVNLRLLLPSFQCTAATLTCTLTSQQHSNEPPQAPLP